VKRKLDEPHDNFIHMTDSMTVITSCLPHMVDKGGHGSSVPNHVKPKLPGKLK